MPRKIKTFKPFTIKPVTDAEREADQAFYKSTRWQAIRRMKLNADPLCERCGSGHYLQVHHIIARKVNPDLAYVFENLETLCRICHSREEMSRRNGG